MLSIKDLGINEVLKSLETLSKDPYSIDVAVELEEVLDALEPLNIADRLEFTELNIDNVCGYSLEQILKSLKKLNEKYAESIRDYIIFSREEIKEITTLMTNIFTSSLPVLVGHLNIFDLLSSLNMSEETLITNKKLLDLSIYMGLTPIQCAKLILGNIQTFKIYIPEYYLSEAQLDSVIDYITDMGHDAEDVVLLDKSNIEEIIGTYVWN